MNQPRVAAFQLARKWRKYVRTTPEPSSLISSSNVAWDAASAAPAVTTGSEVRMSRTLTSTTSAARANACITFESGFIS